MNEASAAGGFLAALAGTTLLSAWRRRWFVSREQARVE